MAANAAGDVSDAYSYLAEYHIMGGDLPLAINQLELALSVPNLTDVQRSKFLARLKELREALPKERARMERASQQRQERLATAQERSLINDQFLEALIGLVGQVDQAAEHGGHAQSEQDLGRRDLRAVHKRPLERFEHGMPAILQCTSPGRAGGPIRRPRLSRT